MDQEQTHFISFLLLGAIKQGVSRLVSSGGSRDKSVLCISQLLEATIIPWFKAGHHSHLCSIITLFSLLSDFSTSLLLGSL